MLIKASKQRQKFLKMYEYDSFLMSNTFPGGFGEGEIPEPIPNSEVKPFIADGTAHNSVGE